MKQEKNTVQFSEIRSKGCNDIEMLERFYMESLKQQLQNFVRENSKQLKYRYD